MADLIQLAIFVAIGYFVGTRIEKKHYRSIKEREKNLSCCPVVTGDDFLEDKPIRTTRLVSGSAVISSDYFKMIVGGLLNFIGGEMSVFESLLDRARREAVLRMKLEAPGADIILNLRLETSTIAGKNSCEALAYGTAVYYQK
ncbi:MAG: heavy metal-binding domain-containing protein [bacterium]|nr:heavy metal-binding domain-containing protein [bacterium]